MLSFYFGAFVGGILLIIIGKLISKVPIGVIKKIGNIIGSLGILGILAIILTLLGVIPK